MTTMDAQELAGTVVVVQDKLGSGIFGFIEYVTKDGWAGVRGPCKRLDEIQVSRLEIDPT